MCGIFGVMNLNGALAQITDLRLMADRMIHRGPDDEGFWLEGDVGLGMRRLSIIDVEGGHQPIANETKDVHIVLNGEIYNYKELREELIERGHKFSTNSDVEVVVHLYEDMGIECIHKINGMFAFALYDQRLDRLWVARDRLGIKPLYYYQEESQFAFASDLNSLNSVVNAPFDFFALTAYLGYSYIPAPLSAYKNIFKLMPGEQIIIENDSIRSSRYWQLNTNQTWQATEKEAINELTQLLEDSISLELRSDVPLGIFLSGGVDSSALAVLAAKQLKEHAVRTFTIDFTNKQGDDTHYAEIVSEHIKSDHHVINVSAEDQLEVLQELIPIMDEPMSDSAIVPTYIISREAKKLGVKVLLSGAGGDEIFGGYSRHFPGKLGSAAWFASLPWILRMALFPLWSIVDSSWALRFFSAARNFAVMISGANLNFLRKVLRSKSDYHALMQKYEIDYYDSRSKQSSVLMKLDLNDYLPNNVLALTDKATMAASVEGRVPLLDHRIVELAFKLPEEINILNGKQKGLFKKVLNTLLPASILTRKKEGFNAPVTEWVEMWSHEIREELFIRTTPEVKKLVDLNVVNKWLTKAKLRKKCGESLYALYILNRWIRSRPSQ